MMVVLVNLAVLQHAAVAADYSTGSSFAFDSDFGSGMSLNQSSMGCLEEIAEQLVAIPSLPPLFLSNVLLAVSLISKMCIRN